MFCGIFDNCSAELLMTVLLCAAFGLCLYQIRRLTRMKNQLLQEKDVMYNFIHEVSEVFSREDHPELDDLLRTVLSYAQQTTKASAGAIYICDEAREKLVARAVSGVFPPMVDTEIDSDPESGQTMSTSVRQQVLAREFAWGESIVGEVGASGVPVVVEDAERDVRIPRFADESLRIYSIMLAPMHFEHKVLGVAIVINRVDDRPFTQSDLDLLQSLADEASVPLHFLNVSMELDKKRLLDSDLRIARKIQAALLPRQIPEFDRLQFSAFSLPAREVGGDYYDFIMIDDTHIGIAIADVSGKGVTGAIIMSICRSAFRAHATGCLDPAQVLKAMNAAITEDMYEDMFISMIYMIVDTETCKITMVRAGHTRPFTVRTASGLVEHVESKGMAIGMTEPEVFDRILEKVEITLDKGDTFVAYTDGIIEAMNSKQTEWGLDNFHQTVVKYSSEGVHRVVHSTRQKLLDYIGGIQQYDDMTLVVIQRRDTETNGARV